MTPRVEIRVRGPVRIEVADRLGLHASVAPALHGVLDRLRTHGLELVEVRRLPDGVS